MLLMIVAVAAWPLAIGLPAVAQTSAKAKPRNVSALVESLIRKNAKNVEIVTFADRRLPPVKIVRGKSVPPGQPETAEIITFPNPRSRPVRIVRGRGETAAAKPRPGRYETGDTTELVTFADPREQPVTVLRGSVLYTPDMELFAPASTIDLDRVAFAVDGAEFEPWRRSENVAPGTRRTAGADAGLGRRGDR